ncbi:Pre-rRNA-processing protein ipi3 [Puttea exsequens]|nr:Pre-rRNA-processing protein ipi3 [Puttea exsequens]
MSSVLLSGSPDSNIHVWSIPQLLSFSASSADQDDSNPPFAPLRSLLNHRDAINAILFGHIHSNNNIAVSASTDKSCLVWDYMEGELLHTFLLAENPLGLALDPADRAVYVGYENGNVQFIDFYRQKRLTQLLHTNEDQSAPTQPDASTIWIAPEATTSAVLCLQVSYDGTNLLSGHKNGKVLSWNVATGSFGKQLADFAAPVTNLHMLKPSGFPNTTKPPLKLQNVVKPRYESFSNGYSDAGTSVPFNYTITAQFTTTLPLPGSSDDDLFHQALTHSSFPPQMLDDSLAQFLASQDPARNTNSSAFAELRAQNAALMSQLNAAEESRRIAAAEIEEFKKLDWRRRQDEELRAAQKQRRRLTRLKSAEVARKKAMGEAVEDDEMEDEGDEEGLSSSTNELTDSG